MAIAITVPRRGWSMEEGTFAGWLKQDGDAVKPGEPLFILESEKAAEEIEADEAGILRIPSDAPKPGDTVKVGQVLAYFLDEGEEVPVSGRAGSISDPSTEYSVLSTQYSVLKTPVAHPPGSPPFPQEAAAPPQAPTTPRPRKIATPRARRVAAELGLDWHDLPGSGRNGRIRERDVRAASPRGVAGRLIPHTSARRTIAARMVAGVTQAAPVTLTTRADATNLVNLRNQFKAAATPDGPVPSYTDLVLKLTAAALVQHPLLQAQWREEGLFVPERVDIALAVDTEAGLLVPVVRGVDNLTLRQVATASRDLVVRARAGRLSADDMRDATFTVTNLGALGIDAFTPIIHLPQCAVLGVGRIVREPAVAGERVVPRDGMTLSLTFDHRIVDGAPAARFLDTLRGCLEQPAPWLMP